MAKTFPTDLSRREREILEIVYAREEATAQQVMSDMADPPTYTAVRTFLKILETKGHLKHTKVGKAYVYRPAASREQAGVSAFQRVLRTFFGGSLEQAMAAHFAQRQTSTDPAELTRIAKLIQDARNEGK